MRPLEKVVPCVCTTRTTGMSGLGETSREPASHLALATHLAGQCLASSGTFRVLTAAQQIETATWYGGDGSAIREKCRQVREFQIATYITSLYSFMDRSFSSPLSLLIETRSNGREMQKIECENCDGTREKQSRTQGNNDREQVGRALRTRERAAMYSSRGWTIWTREGRAAAPRGGEEEWQGNRTGDGQGQGQAGPPVAHKRAERRRKRGEEMNMSRRRETRGGEERERRAGGNRMVRHHRQLVVRTQSNQVVVLVRHGRIVCAAIKVLRLERRLGAHSSRRVVSEHALRACVHACVSTSRTEPGAKRKQRKRKEGH